MNKLPSVVIVQRRLTHYRVPFFNKLRDLLAEHSVDLRLLVGDPTPSEVLKQDEGNLPWAEKIHTTYKYGMCWQPFSKYTSDADMVIITQENKLIYNFLAMSLFRPRRLAFWGHGRNMQSNRPNGVKERFKRWTTKHVDWWFAYTEMSRDFVAEAGFPLERISVVDNAIDTSSLRQIHALIGDTEIEEVRKELGVKDGKVGIFLGSLYADKRLDFLIESGRRVLKSIPDFHLLIVGDGPDRESLEKISISEPWVKILGPRHGRSKMEALAAADIMMNPGLVGLGILDSFIAGVPMVTTDCGLHSPEISYLRNGVNGVMTNNTIEDFTDTVLNLLLNDEQRIALSEGAKVCAGQYTIENMAKKFCDGVLRCLDEVPS